LDLPFYVAYRDRVTRVRPLKLDKPVCRDPDDDVVIATALAAHARAIITGDKDLLVLKQHAGVRMITPRQFLELRITN
jgi:putative PIN family toxin of toxin-antitoxin system